jgi:hypothetical protein
MSCAIDYQFGSGPVWRVTTDLQGAIKDMVFKHEGRSYNIQHFYNHYKHQNNAWDMTQASLEAILSFCTVAKGDYTGMDLLTAMQVLPPEALNHLGSEEPNERIILQCLKALDEAALYATKAAILQHLFSRLKEPPLLAFLGRDQEVKKEMIALAKETQERYIQFPELMESCKEILSVL